MAYASDESEHYEAYVKSFDGQTKVQISTGGGREPLWSHRGREPFYRSGDQMMVAEMAPETMPRPIRTAALFKGPYTLAGPTSPMRSYDLTPDDQQFLMVRPHAASAPRADIHVVLNWMDELKRLVPVH